MLSIETKEQVAILWRTLSGEQHCLIGPAYARLWKGNKVSEEYRFMGIIHRLGGAALWEKGIFIEDQQLYAINGIAVTRAKAERIAASSMGISSRQKVTLEQ